MVLMPGFQSTRLVTEGALEPFFFLYTDDSIQGNPETCKQSSKMLNYEVKNNQRLKSTKLDAGNHGIGLSSVYRATAKYNGTVVIDDSVSERFGIRILLYGSQE